MSERVPHTQVAEGRRSPRRGLAGSVRMRFETAAIDGAGDNISQVGLLFFSDQAIRVVVEVEEDGEMNEYAGRLIRTERMSETNLGLAVEFDAD